MANLHLICGTLSFSKPKILKKKKAVNNNKNIFCFSQTDISCLYCSHILGFQDLLLHHHHHQIFNVQVQGPYSQQWAPSSQLACCMHGRSHTRSSVVSIMRVDGRELPVSAIPLCQLLPSHLGPPRPTLSSSVWQL